MIDFRQADIRTYAHDGELFHACLCDPPYHLTNTTFDAPRCTACGRILGARDLPATECPRCGGALELRAAVATFVERQNGG